LININSGAGAVKGQIAAEKVAFVKSTHRGEPKMRSEAANALDKPESRHGANAVDGSSARVNWIGNAKHPEQCGSEQNG
jgi:hypothetical protein